MARQIARWRQWGDSALEAAGVRPALRPRLRTVLDAALTDRASAVGGRPLAVLDAGCGHKSPLAPFGSRIGSLTGVDIHAPDAPPDYLDRFDVVDLCAADTGLASGVFDLVLTNFTVEHFPDPPVALRNLNHVLAPGGILVVVTVNRRHPFVAAYLAMPHALQRRLQPYVKASAADAHRLVGACNTPRELRGALRAAGFTDIRMETVSNLARSWGRHPASFTIGAVGDLLCQSLKGRRSTIIITGRRAARS